MCLNCYAVYIRVDFKYSKQYRREYKLLSEDMLDILGSLMSLSSKYLQALDSIDLLSGHTWQLS